MTDLQAVLQHVRSNARTLGIDENRIGLWACSGNVPLAFHDSETSREIIRQILSFMRCHLRASP